MPGPRSATARGQKVGQLPMPMMKPAAKNTKGRQFRQNIGTAATSATPKARGGSKSSRMNY